MSLMPDPLRLPHLWLRWVLSPRYADAVIEELERYFGSPLSNFGDPHLAVAKGAVLKAWEEAGQVVTNNNLVLPCKNNVLRDITAHAIGVFALDLNSHEVFAPILKKGVPMPSTFSRTFALREEGATCTEIRILQGDDGQTANQCLELGRFELDGLTPLYGQPHKVEIKLAIDKNGMLTAKACDTNDGITADLQLKYQKAA